jgi:predicted RNA-binding Zn-ribbon protein involved in translation (DUF1610 family)
MENILQPGGIVTILVVTLLFVITIIGVIIPFVIFGINDQLEKVYHQHKTTNRVLDRISKTLEEISDNTTPKKIEDPEEKKEEKGEEDKAEMEKGDEEQKKEQKPESSIDKESKLKLEEKLRKSSITLYCPKCGMHVVTPDLRDGVKHPCPSCGARIEFV